MGIVEDSALSRRSQLMVFRQAVWLSRGQVSSAKLCAAFVHPILIGLFDEGERSVLTPCNVQSCEVYEDGILPAHAVTFVAWVPKI